MTPYLPPDEFVEHRPVIAPVVKLARVGALMALLVALGLPAMPAAAGLGAAPAATAMTHAGPDQPGDQARVHPGDCPSHSQQPKPLQHAPGAPDCCATALCTMAIGLPAIAFEAAPEALPDRGNYQVPALLQPVGFDPPPTTHPPKSAA